MLNNIRYGYVVYSAVGINLVLLWVVGVYLYIKEVHKQKQKQNLLFLVCMLGIMLLYPFSANNIMTFAKCGMGYWMAFMVLPAAVFISYGMTKLIITQQEKKCQKILLGACVLILVISTNFTFSWEDIGNIDNKYKMSEEALEIQQIISGLGSAYVIAPKEIAQQLREYDTTVRVLGGDTEKWTALDDISSNWGDLDKIKHYSNFYGANCIVYPKDEIKEKTNFEKIEFSFTGETENYNIYIYQY